MAEEAVPEELLRNRIPSPIGCLRIGKYDARPGVSVRIVAPHVPRTLPRILWRPPRALEPRMLIRRVIDDELRDDLEPALVRRVEKLLEVLDRAVRGIDGLVRRDVVAIVAQRRRIEWQEPDARRAELLDVVQPLGQTPEVSVAIRVRVAERLHVGLI